MTPNLIGLTGGLCTGKTEIARLLAGLGWPVVSADEIGHELLDGDETCRRAVRERFGRGVFSADGRVNRGRLGEIVFSDAEALAALEAILHPAIRAEYLSRAAKVLERGKGPAIVIEIPLLFETGAQSDFQFTMAVGCTEETQLDRLTARGHLSRDEALRRIRRQLSTEEKMNRADIVIWNQFSREVLRLQVLEAVRALHGPLSA